jgi:hypothetical protein
MTTPNNPSEQYDDLDDLQLDELEEQALYDDQINHEEAQQNEHPRKKGGMSNTVIIAIGVLAGLTFFYIKYGSAPSSVPPPAEMVAAPAVNNEAAPVSSAPAASGQAIPAAGGVAADISQSQGPLTPMPDVMATADPVASAVISDSSLPISSSDTGDIASAVVPEPTLPTTPAPVSFPETPSIPMKAENNIPSVQGPVTMPIVPATPVVSEPVAPSSALPLQTQNEVQGTAADVPEPDNVRLEQQFTELAASLHTLTSQLSKVEEQGQQVAAAADDMKSLASRLAALEKQIQSLQEQQGDLAEKAQKTEKSLKDVASAAVKQQKDVKSAAPSSAPSVPAPSSVQTPEPAKAKEQDTPKQQDGMQAPAAASAPKKAQSGPRYVLRAANPQIAYVARAGSRQLIQVRVGDSLSGIGQVRSIDSEGGRWVVRGTSGTIRQ